MPNAAGLYRNTPLPTLVPSSTVIHFEFRFSARGCAEDTLFAWMPKQRAVAAGRFPGKNFTTATALGARDGITPSGPEAMSGAQPQGD